MNPHSIPAAANLNGDNGLRRENEAPDRTHGPTARAAPATPDPAAAPGAGRDANVPPNPPAGSLALYVDQPELRRRAARYLQSPKCRTILEELDNPPAVGCLLAAVAVPLALAWAAVLAATVLFLPTAVAVLKSLFHLKLFVDHGARARADPNYLAPLVTHLVRADDAGHALVLGSFDPAVAADGGFLAKKAATMRARRRLVLGTPPKRDGGLDDVLRSDAYDRRRRYRVPGREADRRDLTLFHVWLDDTPLGSLAGADTLVALIAVPPDDRERTLREYTGEVFPIPWGVAEPAVERTPDERVWDRLFSAIGDEPEAGSIREARVGPPPADAGVGLEPGIRHWEAGRPIWVDQAELRRCVRRLIDSPDWAPLVESQRKSPLFGAGVTAFTLLRYVPPAVLPARRAAAAKVLRAVWAGNASGPGLRTARRAPETMTPMIGHGLIAGPAGYGWVLGAFDPSTAADGRFLARKAEEFASRYLRLSGRPTGDGGLDDMLRADEFRVGRRRNVPEPHAEGRSLTLFDVQIDFTLARRPPAGVHLIALLAAPPTDRQARRAEYRSEVLQLPWWAVAPAVRLGE